MLLDPTKCSLHVVEYMRIVSTDLLRMNWIFQRFVWKAKLGQCKQSLYDRVYVHALTHAHERIKI